MLHIARPDSTVYTDQPNLGHGIKDPSLDHLPTPSKSLQRAKLKSSLNWLIQLHYFPNELIRSIFDVYLLFT